MIQSHVASSGISDRRNCDYTAKSMLGANRVDISTMVDVEALREHRLVVEPRSRVIVVLLLQEAL